eukprot:498399-Pyramimonas_sp.AAC.1
MTQRKRLQMTTALATTLLICGAQCSSFQNDTSSNYSSTTSSSADGANATTITTNSSLLPPLPTTAIVEKAPITKPVFANTNNVGVPAYNASLSSDTEDIATK